MKIKKFSYFVLAAIAASALSAEINLPRIFSDDMLIQRQKPVKIWGTADANAAVDVEFAGAKKSAKAGKDGKWSVLLDPLEASREGRDMKFYENGTLVNTMSNSIGLATANNLRLLADYYTDQNATNLKMYNFMAYDRVLTADEVKQNYNVLTENL